MREIALLWQKTTPAQTPPSMGLRQIGKVILCAIVKDESGNYYALEHDKQLEKYSEIFYTVWLVASAEEGIKLWYGTDKDTAFRVLDVAINTVETNDRKL